MQPVIATRHSGTWGDSLLGKRVHYMEIGVM